MMELLARIANRPQWRAAVGVPDSTTRSRRPFKSANSFRNRFDRIFRLVPVVTLLKFGLRLPSLQALVGFGEGCLKARAMP